MAMFFGDPLFSNGDGGRAISDSLETDFILDMPTPIRGGMDSPQGGARSIFSYRFGAGIRSQII